MDKAFPAAFDAHGVLWQRDAGDIFLDRRVRGWLADEQEVAIRGANGLADRLVGEQIVTQIDRLEASILRTVGGQPEAPPGSHSPASRCRPAAR